MKRRPNPVQIVLQMRKIFDNYYYNYCIITLNKIWKVYGLVLVGEQNEGHEPVVYQGSGKCILFVRASVQHAIPCFLALYLIP
jgi:hypothetical protein